MKNTIESNGGEGMSRTSSVKRLGGLRQSASKSVLELSTTELDEGVTISTEGNRLRAEKLQRLKQKNEEVYVRRELVKVIKEREEEERILRMEKEMNETNSKFLFTLDIKRIEQQKRQEERQKREEDRKAKQIMLASQEEVKKS